MLVQQPVASVARLVVGFYLQYLRCLPPPPLLESAVPVRPRLTHAPRVEFDGADHGVPLSACVLVTRDREETHRIVGELQRAREAMRLPLPVESADAVVIQRIQAGGAGKMGDRVS